MAEQGKVRAPTHVWVSMCLCSPVEKEGGSRQGRWLPCGSSVACALPLALAQRLGAPRLWCAYADVTHERWEVPPPPNERRGAAPEV